MDSNFGSSLPNAVYLGVCDAMQLTVTYPQNIRMNN